MNVHTSAPRVVVGIDATPASAAGIGYAALEAQRLGAELDIVHAVPGIDHDHRDVPELDSETLAAHGHRLLTEAQTLARSAAEHLTVRTRLLSGSTVTALVAGSEGALLLVLGAERRSVVGRIWTGDIVGGAAAQATCPVVVVAPEWTPSQHHGRIVVGLKSIGSATELLEVGFATAHECKAELVVVHAWRLPSGYDDLISARTDDGAVARRATSLMEPVIDELKQRHPQVPVRIEVRHAQPAYALVNASDHADRLLLARPVHGGRLHHLGAVTRAVLHEARCPVEVVPSQHAERSPHVAG